MDKLVVVTSEPLRAYSNAGYLERLFEQDYYNPVNVAKEVIFVSPFEALGEQIVHGHRVIGTSVELFAREVARIKPDLVRAYGSFWACDLAVYSSPGCPVFVSVHDPNPKLFHNSLQFADKVVCTSEVVAQQALRSGVREDNLKILYNWVDRSVFHAVPNALKVKTLTDSFPNVKSILHVGNKTPAKNIETVVQALQFLPMHFHAFFLGAGDQSPYEKLAQKLNVNNRCHWVGVIPNNDLKYWYTWCDVMCTPSLSEGFGIVFAEAAACGAPIVTSDIAPMNSFFRNGYDAVLVAENKNPKKLAECIFTVVTDSGLRDKLSRNAVETSFKFDRRRLQAQEAELMESTEQRKLSWYKASQKALFSQCYFLRKKIEQRFEGETNE